MSVKHYKNPLRNISEQREPYVPQYQLDGIEPLVKEVPAKFMPKVPNQTIIAAQKINSMPTPSPPSIFVPATPPTTVPSIQPAIGRGRGSIPNVGNSMEQSWSGYDGQITDDISKSFIDPNQPMIDNNDIVSEAVYQSGYTAEQLQMMAQGIGSGATIKTINQPVFRAPLAIEQDITPSPTISPNNELFPIVAALNEGEYLLLVSGTPVCSGSKNEIEEQVREFIFGTHELCQGNSVEPEDIILLKRTEIKVGVFLGE